MNLSSRKDYIEPDYINGVYDEHGKQVIRPLTNDEKAWLNQFYEETMVTNFLHHPDLRKLNRYRRAIIEDDTVKQIQAEIKELNKDKAANGSRIKQLKEIITITKKQNEETYAEQLQYIDEELQDLREEHLLYPDKEDHKQFYNQNNSRNNCIFNRSRSMGKLTDLEIEEYDAYVTSMTQGIDMEDVLISQIEETDWESQNAKVDAIMKEITDYLKKKPKS
jgi:uncharacterized protein (UPF0335 family)